MGDHADWKTTLSFPLSARRNLWHSGTISVGVKKKVATMDQRVGIFLCVFFSMMNFQPQNVKFFV